MRPAFCLWFARSGVVLEEPRVLGDIDVAAGEDDADAFARELSRLPEGDGIRSRRDVGGGHDPRVEAHQLDPVARQALAEGGR